MQREAMQQWPPTGESEADEIEKTATVSKEKLLSKGKELASHLEQFSIESNETFNAFREMGKSVLDQNKLNAMGREIESYEYENAVAILEELLKNLT